MIGKLYQAGIAKYPADVPLRIAYSIFLMQVVKNKHSAINEVIEAESLTCSFDQRFTLFFIKYFKLPKCFSLPQSIKLGGQSRHKSMS